MIIVWTLSTLSTVLKGRVLCEFLLIIDNKLFLPLLVLATMPEASSELIVTQQFDTTNVKVVVV